MKKQKAPKTSLCIFEDAGYKKLEPITLLRASFEVKCGILSLLDKILLEYGAPATQSATEKKTGPKVILACRGMLKETVQERHPECKVIEFNGTTLPNTTAVATSLEAAANALAGACLFINGRILAEPNLSKKIPLDGPDETFVCNGTVVAARLSTGKGLGISPQKQSKQPARKLPQIKTTKIDVKLIDYPWQLIKENSAQIEADYKRINKKGAKKKAAIHKTVTFYKRENTIIGQGATIEAQVVIDARRGPVIIDAGAHIMPLTYIEGPAYIGENSTILGAQIRSGTSIGPSCKVHGEVTNSIIHGYSNKAHYGFLGHSYICEWVNLGAGTTNSNLKNNYGNIKMWNDGQLVDTKEQFMGCLIGDHTKTAIGTMINTGTVISIFCNIFEGMPPKYVPPFSFGMKEKFEIEKALRMSAAALQRRKKQLTNAEKQLIKLLLQS
ncbi:MAG: putative sugar nucleotidyl transferase [Candidatus Margulisiibacteriota bacterium]